MATVLEWLTDLASRDESNDQDSRMMTNLLHRAGWPNAVVVYGIVYLEGKGTMEAPPASIHQMAKALLTKAEKKNPGVAFHNEHKQAAIEMAARSGASKERVNYWQGNADAHAGSAEMSKRGGYTNPVDDKVADAQLHKTLVEKGFSDLSHKGRGPWWNSRTKEHYYHGRYWTWDEWNRWVNQVKNPVLWKKVPSVTYGGKPYFWVMFTPAGKITVVWDRQALDWRLTGEESYSPKKGYTSPVYGHFKTAEAAKKWAEANLVSKNPLNGFVGFYKGKRYEVHADSSYHAQQQIAKEHKIRDARNITVVLAEKDGKQITHLPLMNPRLEKGKWPAINDRAIVANVEQVFRTNNINKLKTPAYHFLMNMPGFIAHYNLNGFKDAYAHLAVLAADIEYGAPETIKIYQRQYDIEQYGEAYCNSKARAAKGILDIARQYYPGQGRLFNPLGGEMVSYPDGHTGFPTLANPRRIGRHLTPAQKKILDKYDVPGVDALDPNVYEQVRMLHDYETFWQDAERYLYDKWMKTPHPPSGRLNQVYGDYGSRA
jgi:hypothetical protein